MIIPVILPKLGDTMDEGTITQWFKHKGDAVTKGEPLFEVLTEKANIEVEATASGFLRKVLYQVNETAPIGKTIAYLTTTADEILELAEGEREKEHNSTAAAQGHAQAAHAEALPARRRQFVSPRARRVAKETGVDVSTLVASSSTGRVMEADVRKFLARQPIVQAQPVAESDAPLSASALSQSFADTIIPIAGVRQIIFDRMRASAQEIARVTLTTEADASELVTLRDRLNAKQKELHFSFTDLLVLLAARALLKYPYMNATLRDDGVHQHAFVNMGVATDTEHGLLVPVIRDAHRKGLGEIYAEVRRLSEAARAGKVSPDDLRGGTFTITNLGAQEIDAFTPLVNQPEIAILGVGRIAQKPAAYQGQLALRWMVALSLSFDHRIVDGAPAAKFLQEVKHFVETPGLVLI